MSAATATSLTAASAKRLFLSSLAHFSKAPPQRCVARTAVRTLTVAARAAPLHPAPAHPYEAAALAFTASPPPLPPLLVLPANHSTSVLSAARPNVIDNNEDQADDAKWYGWGALAVLLGANALAIWCEFNDENSYLRSLATLRKVQATRPQEHERSNDDNNDDQGWRPQRRRTKILHLTWPGTSTKQ